MMKILILKLYFHHPRMTSLAMNLVVATTTMTTMKAVVTEAEADVVVVDEVAGMTKKILTMNTAVAEAEAEAEAEEEAEAEADVVVVGTTTTMTMTTMNTVVTEDVVVDEAGGANRIAVVTTMIMAVTVMIVTVIATAIVVTVTTMTRLPNKRNKIVLRKNGK
jgi:hypothetical protein